MMTDGDLLSRLGEELADAQAYTDDLVGPDRAKALDYYLRRPMGDEREGRSQVISGEVYKVVEGVATAIANIFATAKDAVEFVPRGPNDVEKAEQRTATVNYVFNTQNNGFLAMLESIKDGVLSKTGFLSWRWEVERRVTQERYRNQTPESLAMLVQDNEAVTILSRKEVPGPVGEDGRPTKLIECVAQVVSAKGRCVVESVPPEEVLVSSRARSPDLSRAPAVHWRSYKTREELAKLGYEDEALDQLSFGRSGYTDQQVQRNISLAEGESGLDGGEVLVYTSWLECDCDEDDIAELRRVVWSDDVILENEITDEINLSAWSPNIQPHEFIGRCPADDAIESQEVMTAIKRQTLDNLYLANNPMWRVDASDMRVNVADFYNPEIGRPLRAPPGSADAIIFPFVAQHSFPMLEYEQADTENMTGFTRYAQGMDAKSLNQTARGISIISNMSQQRVQLMARIYGEMCLKPALRGVAKMLSQHGEEALSFRLNGKFVQVDPREWSEEFDMQVTVGLGMADKDQQLMHLTTIAAAQAQAAAAGGMGTLVTPQNIYNVQAKIAENAGFKDASFAWTNPATAEPKPEQPPPPDPAEVKAQSDMQIESMRLQADAQKFHAQAQADMQAAQMKAQADMAMQQAKLESEERIAIARAQIDAQAKVQIAELSAKPMVQIDGREEIGGVAAELQALAVSQTQGLAEAIAMMVAAMERMSAPKRLVRDEAGWSVETVA